MARHHGQKTRGLDVATESRLFEGRFGRMFRGLPVHEHDEAFLRGLADGMNKPSADNPKIPSGFTYLGQFIDHDLTFDPVSSFQRDNDPDALVSFRSPRFDLDSVYGRGPDDDPFMYNQGRPAGVERPALSLDEPEGAKADCKFLIGRIADDDGTAAVGFGEGDDLPRGAQGRAIIGDPRNDENTFISQLQLAFLKFHNRLVDVVAAEQGLTGSALFAEAQRLTRWHYQWVVVHDFLPRLVGENRLARMLKEDEHGAEHVTLRFYKPKRQPFMPLEFSVAAYRFGHSQIRPGYRISNNVAAATFRPGAMADRTSDFRGFRPLPREWTIQWPFLFEMDGTPPQPTLKIDTNLAGPLMDLPAPEFGMEDSPPEDARSLARRNLLRGRKARLPSGGRIARAMGIPEHRRPTADQLGFKGPAPLWFYILKEAEVLHAGEQLGPVGANIVAETFLGILSADPKSYLSMEPAWKPTLPATGTNFTMADLLRFAVPDQAVRVELTRPSA